MSSVLAYIGGVSLCCLEQGGSKSTIENVNHYIFIHRNELQKKIGAVCVPAPTIQDLNDEPI
jgi:hypothetical protein